MLHKPNLQEEIVNLDYTLIQGDTTNRELITKGAVALACDIL